MMVNGRWSFEVEDKPLIHKPYPQKHKSVAEMHFFGYRYWLFNINSLLLLKGSSGQMKAIITTAGAIKSMWFLLAN